MTACYERVKNEYEKRKSASQNKSAKLNDTVDIGARVDKKVTFKNTVQGSIESLGVSPLCRETEIGALQRQIKELEKQELEFSIALHRSQLDSYKSVTDTPTHLDTTQIAKTTPSQHSFPSERSNRCTSIDTFQVKSSDHRHPVRKEKEPDKFDGRLVEWKDFIVHFEQVSSCNRWTYDEQGQQLVMCLIGEAQKLLGDLTVEQRSE